MKITKLDNYVLLEYYQGAIKDSHYNPSYINHNKSDFSLSELENEIMRRMDGNND